jgi:hypothetical protein
VRRPILLLFVMACLVALSLPVATLWQTWQAPVVQTITLVPAHPRPGEIAHVMVTLRAENRSLVSTAPLQIAADMLTMPMGLSPLHVAGDATQGRYVAPLAFTMVGLWQVTLQLHVAAHAPWHTQLVVQVAQDGTLSLCTAPVMT